MDIHGSHGRNRHSISNIFVTSYQVKSKMPASPSSSPPELSLPETRPVIKRQSMENMAIYT